MWHHILTSRLCLVLRKSPLKNLCLQYMWHHILTCKLCVVLRKSPLKNLCLQVHVASHSHLQVDCSAEKESNKKTYAAVHLTSHSHLQVVCSAEKESFYKLMLQYMWHHILTCKLCVVLRKSPLRNLCCSTCDITFSLAIVCSDEKESFKKLMLQYMWHHILTSRLCVVLWKSPLINLCCSTCDITFSLASCV